jgi:glutamyl-tRNA(Gln) amidotransferase subunit D
MALTLDDSGYRGLVLEKLSAAGAKVGDTITIDHQGREYVGILMPRAQAGRDPDHVVIKLVSGYNVGIRLNELSEIHSIKSGKKRKRPAEKTPSKAQSDLPTVSILSTGGTIASKVDYQTGAVNPALSAQDLYDTVPELKDHANIHARIVMSVLSENIQPADWTKIARSVSSEIKKSVDGVVIAHGTDTLGITSAALAFALQDLPVPVVLVGSQRSSDRPSSDAAMNLIRATDFVGHANAAEIMVVMHGETDDTFAYAHRGTRVRKCHTSRRDAFQSVNHSPLFRIDETGIDELSAPLLRRNRDRKLKMKPKFDDRVTIVNTFPGIKPDVIDSYVDGGYKGLVLAGTGLGHAPELIHSALKRAIDAGVIVAMTSQCIWGRINMNVYRPGVEMLEMGVIPCENMLTETATVKLMWLLANTKTVEKAHTAMSECIVGETNMRTEQSEYRIQSEVR